MKITKQYLRNLISEELSSLAEQEDPEIKQLFNDIMQKSKALAGKISTASNTKTKRINFAKGFLQTVMGLNLEEEQSLNRALVTALNKQSGGDSKAVNVNKAEKGAEAAPAVSGDTQDKLKDIVGSK
jgi:DNA uptake protein ComE-like DNA-binding protein